jgi:hypothetical protein
VRDRHQLAVANAYLSPLVPHHRAPLLRPLALGWVEVAIERLHVAHDPLDVVADAPAQRHSGGVPGRRTTTRLARRVAGQRRARRPTRGLGVLERANEGRRGPAHLWRVDLRGERECGGSWCVAHPRVPSSWACPSTVKSPSLRR